MASSLARRAKRFARFGPAYTPVPRYWKWSESLDSDHKCLRVICRDGSTSYPVLIVYHGGPMPTIAECDEIARNYRSSDAGKSRIPACPGIPKH